MITKRDKEILAYMSEYKYATIKQLEKIFFKEQQYSYNIARRRMDRLIKTSYIKAHKLDSSGKIVYILNDSTEKIGPPSLHRLIVLDVLAELHYLGVNVQEFEIEKQWLNGKVRSDAFIICDIQNRRYRFFLEVHISNNKHNLEKYSVLHDSGEVQDYVGSNTYPRVLLVSDRKYKNTDNIPNVNVLRVGTDLDGLLTIFL